MIMNKPAVSVIINCLDGERYLQSALDCLRAQTFQDFEIIFWDNCSQDASADIAQGYGSRLRYFRSDEIAPLGMARNMAIAKAKGELIAFLDCDDLWRPAKLEKQVALFRNQPGLGLACTDTEVCKGATLLYKLFDHSSPARGRAFEELMLRQWISMSSAMVRMEALKSIAENGKWFDEELDVCEEADVFYRIAHDWDLDYIAEPLTVWRVHGANSTFDKFGQFGKETLHILAKHRRLYEGFDAAHPAIVEELTNRAAFQQAVAAWKDGEGARARAIIAPHRHKSRKYNLFWWVSFLPGSAFHAMASVYFALPEWIRNSK